MLRLVLVILFLFLFSISRAEKPKKVCIKNACVRAERVYSEEDKKRGLIFRKDLAEASGMLFEYDKEDYYAFWMKNMNFALDIIWIDKNKKIAYIKKNALPCKQACEPLFPGLPAKYILEVKSGFTDKNKINIGDKVEFYFKD